jgi:hypothetical protein
MRYMFSAWEVNFTCPLGFLEDASQNVGKHLHHLNSMQITGYQSLAKALAGTAAL